MPSCCGGSTCACKIDAGASITITGTGMPNDPFVISSDLALGVVDNQVFDMALTGTGTGDDPWGLGVNFADTASITDLPDVAATAPSNGQVLAWNSDISQWIPQNPVTAPTGAVVHDTSLGGDGSASGPLSVIVDGTYFVASRPTGVGLSDAAINRQVRHFVNAADRDSATPPPVLNTLSVLDSAPGRVDYWDGTQWLQEKDNYAQQLVAGPGGNELLRLSGPYTNQPLTYYVKQFSAVSDGSGQVTLLGSGDLTGRAGIISCTFQEVGSLAMKVVPFVSGATIKGNVWHLTDGAAWAAQTVTGTVFAWLY